MKVKNREIRFRGKRLDNDMWIYGSLVQVKDYAYIVRSEDFDVVDDENIECNDWFQIDPKTIGQYTGLNDKKGIKIYSGDIVSFSGYKKDRVEVIEWVNIGKHTSFGAGIHNALVIGNIYENPELLTEGKR